MEDTKQLIIQAAIKGVRLYGIEGVRVSHIGKLSGAPGSSIYTYFSGKEELLCACFVRVDREIAAIFDHVTISEEEVVTNPEAAIRKLWTPYYRWLVEHPDETVFYHRFRDAPQFPAYNAVRDVSYFTNFVKSVRKFYGHFQAAAAIPTDILWLHVLTATVSYAKYVVEGVLKDDAATEEVVFAMMMHGLGGVIAASAAAQSRA